jgi:hypothetical protein
VPVALNGAEQVAKWAADLAGDDAEVSESARKGIRGSIGPIANGEVAYRADALKAMATAVTSGDTPTDVRRQFLYVLAHVGTEAEVPAVASVLSDPELGEDSLYALDRIPGDASTDALIAAIDAATPERAARIVDVLARRDGEAVQVALQSQAGTMIPSVTWAALEGLARFGITPNQLWEEPPTFLHEDQDRYLRIYLNAASAMEAMGKGQHAVPVYQKLADQYLRAHLVVAALQGLARQGSPHAERYALGYLGEPGIRHTAADVLTGSKQEGVDADLKNLYTSASAPIRTTLLDIAAARQADGLDAWLVEAQSDEDAEVRVKAARLAGAEIPLKDLQTIMDSGSPWAREEIVNDYIDAGKKALGTQSYTKALKIFETVVASTVSNESKTLALRIMDSALIHVIPVDRAEALLLTLYGGAPKKAKTVGGTAPKEAKTVASAAPISAGSVLSPLQLIDAIAKNDSAVATAGGLVYVSSVSAHAEPKDIEVRLSALAEMSEVVDVIRSAIGRLEARGVDTAVFPKRRGFLTEWNLAGPFPSTEDASMFGQVPFDMTARGYYETISHGGQTFDWKAATAYTVPAVVNLNAHMEPNEEVVAYAYTSVMTDKPDQAKLLIGSNDGCVVWVNGEKVFEYEGGRGLRVDDDELVIDLKLGLNLILMQVANLGGGWEFCARLTDAKGAAFNVAEQRYINDVGYAQ